MKVLKQISLQTHSYLGTVNLPLFHRDTFSCSRKEISKSKTMKLKERSVLTFLPCLSNSLGKCFHLCISNQTRVGQGKTYQHKPIKTVVNVRGRRVYKGTAFHGPSVWLWLYLNLRAYYVYSCDYVAMTATILKSFYRKGTTTYS